MAQTPGVLALTVATFAIVAACGLYGCVVGAQRPGVRANGRDLPPRVVETPEPAPSGSSGAWQPGYWHYDGSQYVWVPGRWVDAQTPLGGPR